MLFFNSVVVLSEDFKTHALAAPSIDVLFPSHFLIRRPLCDKSQLIRADSLLRGENKGMCQLHVYDIEVVYSSVHGLYQYYQYNWWLFHIVFIVSNIHNLAPTLSRYAQFTALTSVMVWHPTWTCTLEPFCSSKDM